MIVISIALAVVGLFFFCIGYRVIDRSSGSVSGVLTGVFMLLLGLGLIVAGFLLHGFIPAFV